MSLRPVSRAVSVVAVLLIPPAALAAPGDPIGPAVAVNAAIAANLGQEDTDIALTPDGRSVIVWNDKLTSNGQFLRILGRRVAANGTPQGAEFRIDSGILAANHPRVGIDAAGNFVVVWQQSTEADQSSRPITGRVFMRRYNASGTPLSAPILVDSTPIEGHEQFNPSISMNAQGQFVIAWNSYHRTMRQQFWELSEGPVLARRFMADGTPLGATQLVADRTSGSLLVSQGAGLVRPGGALQLLFATQGPSVALRPDGSFVVAWTSGSMAVAITDSFIHYIRAPLGLQSVKAQGFDSAGNKQGRPSEAAALVSWNDPLFETPDVALTPDGGYALAWSQYNRLRGEGIKRGIFLRRYDAAGKAVGSAVEVMRDAGSPTVYDPSQAPSIAVDANGNMTVVATAARSFASNGSPLGPTRPTCQGTTSTFIISAPRLDLHANGDYQLACAARVSVGTSGVENVVLSQRFDGP
ncbi:MAG TPA: hypothetical protein VGE22_12625 [Solimonas sp.]